MQCRSSFGAVLILAAAALMLACKGDSGPAGLSGTSALIAVVPIGAGASCANGGVEIEVGADANGNGQLDATEVDASKTQFVCNGSSGTTTAATLNRVAAEPAGANCQEGGLRIETGVDANQNGVLDDAEVEAGKTQFVCDASVLDKIHFGDVTLRSAADLSALSGDEVLMGSLTLNLTDFTSDVSVDSLEVITGGVLVEDDNTPLDLRVSRSGLVAAVTPIAVSFPNLRQVVAPFSVQSNLAGAVSLPSLTTAAGLELRGSSLSSVDASALVQIPSINIFGTALTRLTFPILTTAGEFSVQQNPSLTALSAPALTSANFDLFDDAQLATFDLPALTQSSGNAGRLTTDGVCRIEALNLAVFQRLGSGVINDSEDDSSCNASALCPLVTVSGATGSYRQCFLHRDWATARSMCEGFGQDLAVIPSATEFAAVSSAASAGRLLGNSYLGYDNIGQSDNSNYVWVDGSTTYTPQSGDSTFWNSGEPNDSGGSEHCAGILSDGLVNDFNCSNEQTFLCH